MSEVSTSTLFELNKLIYLEMVGLYHKYIDICSLDKLLKYAIQTQIRDTQIQSTHTRF